MAKILITSIRAPGSLEWIRALSKNHEVYGMDSLKYPVGRFSKHLKEYIQICSPKSIGFEKMFLDVLDKYEFDLIIPTSEEIFHIKELSDKVLACDAIYNLHSKHIFSTMAFADWSGNIPKTILKNNDEIQDDLNHVFKPEHTRFGSEVYICPKNNTFVKKHHHDKWLQQEYIKGDEICSYTLAYEGDVIVNSFYQPVHRSGKAGIYFNWITDDRLARIIAEFIKHYKLSGQISFDVIKKDDEYYFIECNPRMTSGIHNVHHDILKNYVDLILTATTTKILRPINLKPSMLCLLNIGKNGFFDAKDVIYDSNDQLPFLGQFISFGEIVLKSLINGQTLVETTVSDICYP
jgi:hypothetical protein